MRGPASRGCPGSWSFWISMSCTAVPPLSASGFWNCTSCGLLRASSRPASSVLNFVSFLANVNLWTQPLSLPSLPVLVCTSETQRSSVFPQSLNAVRNKCVSMLDGRYQHRISTSHWGSQLGVCKMTVQAAAGKNILVLQERGILMSEQRGSSY